MDKRRDFASLHQGMHLCSIYRNVSEQLAVTIPFMIAGLKNRERCVSIVSKETKEEMTHALHMLGIDVKACQYWGQFLFLDASDTYISQGYFDPERMMRSVAELEQESLRLGFSGVRGIGDATWFFSRLPGTQRLIEYEAKLNNLFPGRKTLALCLYDENLYEKNILLDVLHTHPTAFVYDVLSDNPYYLPPDQFLKREHEENPDAAYARKRDALLLAR